MLKSIGLMGLTGKEVPALLLPNPEEKGDSCVPFDAFAAVLFKCLEELEDYRQQKFPGQNPGAAFLNSALA